MEIVFADGGNIERRIRISGNDSLDAFGLRNISIVPSVTA